jgi:hypothetical protein
MRAMITTTRCAIFSGLAFTLVAGCRTGGPAPQPATTEDWYRKERLFDAFDADAPGLSLVNAYLLGLGCYVGDRGTFEVDRTLETWGFDKRRDFRDLRTSTYGYVASNDRIVLVTFGGTDFMNVRDLLSDVDALQLVYDDRYCATDDARVHRGFRDSLNSVIDGVIDEVRRQSRPRDRAPRPDNGGADVPGKRLWIAGHSRGGAFAVLAAAGLARQRGLPELAGVYTFGQPRVGNGPFAETIAGVPLFRFVNRDDPIPNVPPAGLLPPRLGLERVGNRHGYQHAGVAVHLRADGRVVRTDDTGGRLPDPMGAQASIGNHYQTAYYRAIYSALTDPQLIQEPSRRGAVAPNAVGALPPPAK